MNKLTMGSLFDGIGGFILAGNQVGIDTLWSSEIDPACEAVTKFHFPTVAQMGDITKIDGAKVPPVDIICGGSPCQDLSVAGKRAGLAGERSGLYMEQIRIIREMRAATNNTYPRYMVWENVPGALSSNKGDDFRAVLEEAARCADKTVSIPESKKWSNAGCIVGNGWSIAWRILDAQFWGVPQRRRRIFLVADFGSERAGEVLFKQEGLRGYSAEGREAREGITADAKGSTGRSSYGVTTKGNGDAFISQERHTSLSVGGGQAGQGYPCILQEFDGRVFNESGQGYWMPEFGCLRAEGENRPTRPGHCVVQEVKCLNPNDPQTMRVYDADGLYPALTSNASGGQNRQAICLQANGIDRKEENGCCGKGWTEDISYTLNTIDRHAVVFEPRSAFEENWAESSVKNALRAESSKSSHAVVENVVAAFMSGQGAKARTIAYSENVSPSLKSVPSGGNTIPDIVYGVDCRNHCVNDISATLQAKENGGQSLNYINPVLYAFQRSDEFIESNVCSTESARQYKFATDLVVHGKPRKYIIRRLTPLECERLQGFPDNWCAVEYKNKPMSDSARYRMCGNSVATPCVVRVLGGIVDIHNGNV